MRLIKYLLQDWRLNKSAKSRLIVFAYRFCHSISRSNVFVYVLFSPVLVMYRITVEWFLGVEIPFKTRIGSRLRLFHGQALVINNEAIIGDNCTLRHSTTIGNSKQFPDGTWNGSPIIGDNVDIGSNCVIIGPIIIGNNVKIAAGSVVVKSVPSNCTVAGNPARAVGAHL